MKKSTKSWNAPYFNERISTESTQISSNSKKATTFARLQRASRPHTILLGVPFRFYSTKERQWLDKELW